MRLRAGLAPGISQHHSSDNGFSLLELMLTINIIGVVGTIHVVMAPTTFDRKTVRRRVPADCCRMVMMRGQVC
jgi:prepilin-type N-terminal cleavage/methylation domain-containing protein